MKTNIIYNMDCIEGCKKHIPNNSIDLIVTDPPYNIGIAGWDKIDNYLEWCLNWLLECQRVLKDTGSIYIFHNDIPFISILICEIDNKTNFIFKQLIVWNKRFADAKNKAYLDGCIQIKHLRNYQKMAEYILFYTFQDETGLSKVMGSCVYPIRDYIRTEIIRAKGKIILKEINKVLGTATNGGGVASAILSKDKTVPTFITKEHYEKLRRWLNDDSKEYEYLRKEYEHLRKEYEHLRKEYEYLRKEYEHLRYTFNNQRSHHSVWDYNISEKTGHITSKPTALINNILLHSSNENDIVLDMFGGSGTTAISCIQLNRKYILFEKEKEFYNMSLKRIERENMQLKLF